MTWQRRKVLVTGGASFIGSHLVDALLEQGANVRVVDDLSSGRVENIQQHLDNGGLEFVQVALREPGITRQALQGSAS
jgi:nucleoside-diphosphate-sugar epimerase